MWECTKGRGVVKAESPRFPLWKGDFLFEDVLDSVRERAGAFFGRLAGVEKSAIQRVDDDGHRKSVMQHGQDPAEDLRGRRENRYKTETGAPAPTGPRSTQLPDWTRLFLFSLRLL